jgi:hypothetical protein
MKKVSVSISLILIVLLLLNCRNASEKTALNTGAQSADTGTPVISFSEYEHHFGKVKEGEKVGYTFTFVNQGTADLVIASASTTCGCTVPKYDKKPVHPGKNGSLEVVFNTSGRSGMQTKTITVASNASKPVVILKITAEVENEN